VIGKLPTPTDIDYNKVLEMIQSEVATHVNRMKKQNSPMKRPINTDLETLRIDNENRFSELEARLEKQMKLSLHQNFSP
jgi:hypothetical protein